MDLGVDGEAAVFEALDEMRLPQRPAAVEQRAVPPRRQLEQLANAPRARHCRPTQRLGAVHLVVERPGALGDPAEPPAWVLSERRLKVVALDARLVRVTD